MKKFIAVLISMILVISSFTVYAADEQHQNEVEAYKEIISQYFEDEGYHFSYDSITFSLVGKFGDKALVSAFVGEPVEDEQYHKIGSYDILSVCGFSPYRLALYVIRGSEVYTFEEAYEKGIIDDATFDEMVDVMQNNPDNRFHYLRFTKQEEETPDVSDKSEKITLTADEAAEIVKSYGYSDTVRFRITATQAGNAGDCAIIIGYLTQIPITDSDGNEIFTGGPLIEYITTEIDGYKIDIEFHYDSISTLLNARNGALFIYDGEKLYDIATAINEKVVTMAEVYNGYNNTVDTDIVINKMETTEPTEKTTDPTQPTTEPKEPTNPNPTEPTLPAPKSEISAQKISLKAGKTKKITVSNGTVKSWKSSDKKIATVKNGKVTALKKGNATITAMLTNGEKLTAKVKVTSNPKLNKTTKKLKVKGKFTIKINGKVGTPKFTSNNKKIATVTKKGVVKAKKKGTATITVTTNGGVKLKCKITVK